MADQASIGDRADAGPPDPLTALRAADSRPLADQWRDRLYQMLRPDRAGRRPRLVLVVATVGLLALVTWRLIHESQPPIEDSIPLARPEPTLPAPDPDVQGTIVVIHVAGAVRTPGLVEGPADWRVADAIAAAGGTTAAADLDRVNLAAPVRDGERIFVPLIGRAVPALVAGTGATPSASTPSGPVDLNTADVDELQELPGVGPSTAATIVAHRDEYGPFGSVDALVEVRGIGPAKLDALRQHVTVG